jgi:hypothetical protein
MFKNIFKAAKNLVRSPIGQIGLGILVPGLAGTSGILGGIGSFAAKNPALFQAGLGLLGGAKPQDVLQNVALGAASAGLMGGRGGIESFFGAQPQVAQTATQNLNRPGFVGRSGGGTFNLSAAPTDKSNLLQFFDENVEGIVPSQSSMIVPSTPTPNLGASDFSIKNANDLVQGAAQGKEGFLDKFNLINKTKVITNPDGSQSVVPVTDFFEKYSTLLKLGSVGASVAAAALGEDQARMLYDPEQNPYLTGQVKIQDAYTPAGFNQGGGISDFPEKDGMINGPGDGQSDDIPAMLSDGEFVMTKQAVMAAGNGDRKQGTKAMYNIMNSLEDKAESMGIGRM